MDSAVQPHRTISPPEKLRFSEVDGLRAVACAFVIIFHASGVFQGAANHRWALFDGGKGLGVLGVLVFFAISGYVIPSSLRGKRVAGFKRFAIRRFWRLWPPFWVSLLLFYFSDVSRYTGEQLIFGITMFPGLFGVSSIGTYFWTLEIELLFYAIVAVAFLVLGQLGRKVTVGLFLLALAWCWTWPNLPSAGGYWIRIPVFLTIMLWGACCRALIKEWGIWQLGGQFSKRAISIGLVSGLVSIWPVQGAYFSFLSGDLYHVKAAAVMLAAIFGFLFWVVLTPVRVRWLARIGRWTYSTYLFHGVVLYSFLEKFKRELAGWPLPICILGALILSFALGGFLYRYLEQPSDRIGRRLSDEGQPTTR